MNDEGMKNNWKQGMDKKRKRKTTRH